MVTLTEGQKRGKRRIVEWLKAVRELKDGDLKMSCCVDDLHRAELKTARLIANSHEDDELVLFLSSFVRYSVDEGYLGPGTGPKPAVFLSPRQLEEVAPTKGEKS